ncbi:MAG: hypothetical protein ACO3JP_03540, partial [Schleiferiaceae bacterium]
ALPICPQGGSYFFTLCERVALVSIAGEAEYRACASQTDELETFVHTSDIVRYRKGSLPSLD